MIKSEIVGPAFLQASIFTGLFYVVDKVANNISSEMPLINVPQVLLVTWFLFYLVQARRMSQYNKGQKK